jgi:predicted nucleic acid-binding protein
MIVVDATVLADFLVGDEKLKARASALADKDPL